MTALSGYLMVTGGNVAGRSNALIKAGLVAKRVDAADHRSYQLRLTSKGRKIFEEIAAVHESWVILLFAGPAGGDSRQVADILGRLRASAAERSKSS